MSLPTSIVTWKWKPPHGYRSTYGPAPVNTLRRMVARHFPHPHRFVCVTDDPEGLDSEVDVVPLWNDFADVPNPFGHPRNPSCYRRLRAFAPDIAATLGERFVSMDLDVVITADLTPLWDRSEDFVIWGDTNPAPGSHYNGSMFLLTAGSRSEVWRDFHPLHSPREAKSAGCFGSDQGWISYRLGPGQATWTSLDGVYSHRNHILPGDGHLPANARIVVLHGHQDPWDAKIQSRHRWLREAYV